MENTRSRAAEINWPAIHESIQAIFASLAEVVQAECPAIRSRGGKTQTDRFPLFSYRTFEVPSHAELDPVVVGIHCNPLSSDGDVAISADMCGEETGRIWFELAEQTVSAIQDVLRAATEALARKLGEQKDRILVALNQQKTASSRCAGTEGNGIGIARKEYESRS